MSNTRYSYELQSIQLPLQLIKDINSSRTSKDYIFSTLQGLQRTTSLFAAIKDINSSRTSIHQGHRLFKDIDTTTRTTSLHCNQHNIIMATVQEYDDILRYKTSTSNKYRSGLSENEKRNIRDKASR